MEEEDTLQETASQKEKDMKAKTDEAKVKSKDMATDGMTGTKEKDGEKAKGMVKVYSPFTTVMMKRTAHREEQMTTRTKKTKKVG